MKAGRIQIKKYPKLTSVGGFTKDPYIGFNRDLMDSASYGGFYTHDDIKEVVKYATERFVTIVPEIEMSAHSVAALRAYPEFKVKVSVKNTGFAQRDSKPLKDNKDVHFSPIRKRLHRL